MIPSSHFQAGSLRQRVDIECPIDDQNDAGEIVRAWVVFASGVPASVEPISGREFIAAAKETSSVTARIKIRYRPDLDASMRVKHGATIYSISAILPDPISGREWLTIIGESK